MADPITLVAAAGSLASGVFGYLGQQAQADQLDAQAKNAELLGRNQAQVIKNNAIAQQQDEAFNASVAQFNKREQLELASREAEKVQLQERAATASLRNTLGKRAFGGASVEDVLSSNALKFEQQENEILYSAGQQSYQQNVNVDMAQFRANRAIETGKYQSSLAISEGRTRATTLRNQADSARFASYGELAGGVLGGVTAFA